MNSIGTWGGAGTIHCNDCGYKEDVISFIHGIDENGASADGSTGYQCQSCGKFQTLDDFEVRNKCFICSCGGELDRDAPMFCPQCKSWNMDYKMNYIT
jgi:hypothetical protein